MHPPQRFPPTNINQLVRKRSPIHCLPLNPELASSRCRSPTQVVTLNNRRFVTVYSPNQFDNSAEIQIKNLLLQLREKDRALTQATQEISRLHNLLVTKSPDKRQADQTPIRKMMGLDQSLSECSGSLQNISLCKSRCDQGVSNTVISERPSEEEEGENEVEPKRGKQSMNTSVGFMTEPSGLKNPSSNTSSILSIELPHNERETAGTNPNQGPDTRQKLIICRQIEELKSRQKIYLGKIQELFTSLQSSQEESDILREKINSLKASKRAINARSSPQIFKCQACRKIVSQIEQLAEKAKRSLQESSLE